MLTRLQNLTLKTSIAIVAAGTLLVLLIPFVGTIASSGGFRWNTFDFVVMGTLLFGVGMLAMTILRSATGSQRKLIALAVVGFAFFLLWAELAVGLFGSPVAGS